MNGRTVSGLALLQLLAVPFATSASPGIERARISLPEPAYVHMPVWIAVTLPGRHQGTVRYPITVEPADIGGHDFEVLQNGIALPKLQTTAAGPKAGSGPVGADSIGGGKLIGLQHEPRQTGRLPLHLLFRFDRPGSYQVRYTGYDWGSTVLARSDWLTIQVEPYSDQQRSTWLSGLLGSAPNDGVELLADFLPSLLALPDAKVLRILEPYLYHSDDLVRHYTKYALFLFDDAEILRRVPEVIRRRGPTPELAYFVSWRQHLFAPQSERLVRASLEHLDSKSPLIVAGAMQSLVFTKLNASTGSSPDLVSEMDALVTKRAGSLMRQDSREVLQLLASYLGGVNTDRSRRLLWQMVDQGTALEQALICLTWIGDPRDLPRLATYLDRRQLRDALQRAYGDAAAPYLKRPR